jgi:sec-independent protein translocase protein TatB
MANLGMADSLIIMVIALVAFGPRKLPQIGRQIGKLMYEFRKASNDFKFQMEEELRSSEEADRRKKEEDRLRALALTVPAQPVLADSVSQIPDAKPGAPSDPAADPTADPAADPKTDSPYLADGVYPPTHAASTEPLAEETYPRIQPPSTGEQIAAARPSLTALAQAAKDQQIAASVDTESANQESGPAEAMVSEGAPAEPGASEPEQAPAESEQAAHHG